MKKSLIAMSIAAAAAAPMAANAAGTVFAHLQAEVYNADTGNASANGTLASGTHMADSGSQGRLGFKGSEELGNGMTMIGKAEFTVDTTSGALVSGKRESFVGIKGGFGTLTLGRLKSPYKYAGGVKYDPFVTTALEARGVTMSGKAGTGNAMGHNSFQSDSVGLSLMGGKFYATLGVDESNNNGDITASYKHSLGKKDEIVVAVASQGSDQGDYQAVKLGGSFGPVKAQFESTDDGTNADTFLFVTYGMDAAGGKVVIQGGQADGDSYTDAVTDVTIGYIKKFTKSSRWYAGVKSNSGDDETQVLTYGMRFDY